MKLSKKIFESLLQNYKKDLKEAMRGSDFVPDSIIALPSSIKRFEKR